jgi:hypothetical protein
MKVTNITANDVALNYVSTSGSIIATTLSGSESRNITSQTLPLGLDFNSLVGLSDNTWLSASFISNYTGSISARPTGSRFFEMAAIRTISQATNMYTIADGDTNITKTSLSSPVSGSSFRYVCSRTIPYLDQPFWLISDLFDCTGGTTTTTTTSTTTTTTSGPTTTTTTIPPFSYITASVTGATNSGQYVSGGFTWQFYEFYSSSTYNPTFTVLSGNDTGSKLLIIGAGGSGGTAGGAGDGGGGGAGQVIYVDNFTLTSGSSYTLTVPGYAPSVTSTQGINGSAAVGFGYTANGGGGGGAAFPNGEGRSVTGGSGGGGSEGELGGTGTFNGGESFAGASGAGGGGASGNGNDTAGGATSTPGNGGTGLTFTINGSPMSVAGGGGGGSQNNVPAATGADGGGTGATFDTNSSEGLLGTGAGGGGGRGPSDSATGEGGSGRIVIAYKIPPATTTTSTTTTTTLSTKKYLIESCEGPGDISATVNILNAPTLAVNQRVHVVGSYGGYYCFRIANTNPAGTAIANLTIDAIYPDCESCPEF